MGELTLDELKMAFRLIRDVMDYLMIRVIIFQVI